MSHVRDPKKLPVGIMENYLKSVVLELLPLRKNLPFRHRNRPPRPPKMGNAHHRKLRHG